MGLIGLMAFLAEAKNGGEARYRNTHFIGIWDTGYGCMWDLG